MANVGGDPSHLSGGAASLHASGTALEHLGGTLTGAGRSVSGSAGEPALVAAAERFFSAWSTLVTDTGTQLRAAGQLASSAAADLATAGGGH